MKASKFTDAQKAFVIKQGEEGTPLAEVPFTGDRAPSAIRRQDAVSLRNSYREDPALLKKKPCFLCAGVYEAAAVAETKSTNPNTKLRFMTPPHALIFRKLFVVAMTPAFLGQPLTSHRTGRSVARHLQHMTSVRVVLPAPGVLETQWTGKGSDPC